MTVLAIGRLQIKDRLKHKGRARGDFIDALLSLEFQQIRIKKTRGAFED